MNKRLRWPCITHLNIREVSSQWPCGSRGEVQYRFRRWRPSWISNQNDFDLQVTSILPMSFQSSSHLVQETKFKTDFQHGGLSDHLGFPIGTISLIFDQLVTLTLAVVSSQLAFLVRKRSSKHISMMSTVAAN